MANLEQSDLMQNNVMSIAQQTDSSDNRHENIVELLKSDHKKVKELLESFEESEDKLALLSQIINEIKIHADLEQEIVYPFLRKKVESEKVDEAYVEHEVVRMLIDELSKTRKADAQVNARVKVLGELVTHHIEEEENEMLPELGENSEAENLGQQFMKAKEKLLARASKAGRRAKAGASKSKVKRVGVSRGKRSKTDSRSSSKSRTPKRSSKQKKSQKSKASKSKSTRNTTGSSAGRKQSAKKTTKRKGR